MMRLGERAARALGDQHIFADELHPGLVIRLRLSLAIEPEHPCDNAAHRAIIAEHQIGAGKARIDLDPERLRLLRQPAADIAQRHRIIAVIAHEPRQQDVGDAQRPARAEHVEAVLRDLGIERRPALLPVGDELVERDRIDHRAGKNVRPDLGSLLEHADRDVGAGRRRELLETDRRREAGRPAADDHHVELHQLALDLLRFHRVPSPVGSTAIAPVIVDGGGETIPRLRQNRIAIRQRGALA